MTLDKLKQYIALEADIYERLKKVDKDIYQIRHGNTVFYTQFNRFEISEDEEYVFLYYINYSCGEINEWTEEYPISYLLDDNYLEYEMKMAIQKKENEKRAKEILEKQERLIQEEREKKLFLELKKKYEDT